MAKETDWVATMGLKFVDGILHQEWAETFMETTTEEGKEKKKQGLTGHTEWRPVASE